LGFEVKYSSLDRLIHQLAFGSLSIQFTAAEIEKYAFGNTYKKINISKPIFITSLPRAGTTLMLEALQSLPSLATHTYRDMPFIMAPVLWNRMSVSFRKRAQLKERAHGDGMRVGFDSPEAFEEILWRAFWPDKYKEDSIELWEPSDAKGEATSFFIDHMKKIILLRGADRAGDGRYISKNNGNMARLKFIKQMIPDAKLLIPIRDPLEHANSLLTQHLNFLKMHGEEPFVRRYMRDIGHYEFGDLHRPVAFPGLKDWIAPWDPHTINYWLAYWMAAYEHVREQRDFATLVSYERTCSNPRTGMADICEQLEIQPGVLLGEIAALFRPPPPARADLSAIDPALQKKAQALHQELIQR